MSQRMDSQESAIKRAGLEYLITAFQSVGTMVSATALYFVK